MGLSFQKRTESIIASWMTLDAKKEYYEIYVVQGLNFTGFAACNLAAVVLAMLRTIPLD